MSDVPLLEPLDESDEALDESITALRATGMSLPRIARHLMIPLHVLHRRLDAILPVVDAAYRRRAIAESLVTIDTIIAKHMATIADPESASVVIRSVCERRSLLGVTGSSDPVQLSMQSRPEETSMSAITRGLDMIESLRRLANEKPSTTTPHGAPDCGAPSDTDADESS